MRPMLPVVLAALLSACSPDPAPPSQDTERPPPLAPLARDATGAAEMTARPLTDALVKSWCAIVRGSQLVRAGPTLNAETEAQAVRRRLCADHGLSFLEFSVLNARISVALVHVEKGVPHPADRAADVAIVTRHLDAIRSARGY